MRRLALAACVALAACGGDTSSGGTPDAGGSADVRLEPTNDTGGGGTTDADNATDMGGQPDLPAVGDECESDFDCSDGIFCNGVERCFRGLCFSSPTEQCWDMTSCTMDECDETNQRCNFIPDDSLCAPGQVCRAKGGCFTPAACAADADCDDGLVCNGTERCSAGSCEPGEPVECGDGLACTTDTCVEGTGECQSVADHTRCLATELCVPGIGCSPRPPCMSNDDCDDGAFCNGAETCGPDAVCLPGEPPLAPDNVPCTIDQCNEALDLVVSTPDNARCSDGVFCNGAEVCHPTDGCTAGVPPALSDGIGCTVDTCNETLRIIEHAPDDMACDDGAFCNGAEVCHPITGCAPGEPPMLNDGIGCTVDTCSEIMDVVLHVTDDSLCDDGLYCNGTEICSRTDDCVTGLVPVLDDGIACTADSCDETLDAVVHVPNNAACGAGDMCTAGEVCDVALGCVAGPPVVIDDNIACTVDTCDPMTGVSHTPNDGACNDGLFCNGVETCGGSGCVAGTPPTDDGNPCTIDTCLEATDQVTHLPATNGTVCGGAPRSVCLSGSCAVSVCGDNYTDTGRGETCDDGNTNSNDGCSSTCQTEAMSCDPDGTYLITQIAGNCGGGLANWQASSLTLAGDGTFVTGLFTGFISPTDPTTMTGSGATCPSGTFTVSTTLPGGDGGCDETYSLTATFTGPNTWSGTFTASFSGDLCAIAGCGATQQQAVNGLR